MHNYFLIFLAILNIVVFPFLGIYDTRMDIFAFFPLTHKAIPTGIQYGKRNEVKNHAQLYAHRPGM